MHGNHYTNLTADESGSCLAFDKEMALKCAIFGPNGGLIGAKVRSVLEKTRARELLSQITCSVGCL